MYIETRGQGPALALIHGWAMHGGLFAPLVERLQDRYTLHLIPHRFYPCTSKRAGRVLRWH